jgi:hypothetical protein
VRTHTVQILLTLEVEEPDGTSVDYGRRHMAEYLADVLVDDFGHPDPNGDDPDAVRDDGYRGPFVTSVRSSSLTWKEGES